MSDCTAENSGFENAPSPAPRISKIWRDVITHPAGASGEVAIVHVYYDWTDGAQTCRCQPAGEYLCVHPGTGWPDALESCDHIAALGGAK